MGDLRWLAGLFQRRRDIDTSMVKLSAAIRQLAGLVAKQSIRIRDLKGQRSELRAVLAPLLDEPYVKAGPCPGGDNLCAFCGMEWREWHPHATDCPVRRRAELLGRKTDG
jgi:hypothetical protein